VKSRHDNFQDSVSRSSQSNLDNSTISAKEEKMAGFDFTFLLIAFGGGIYGAAVGGLPSFIMMGLAAAVGAGLTMINPDLGGQFTGLVAWGPFLGPHVGFAGGAAAAAYAMKKGKIKTGRDISIPLMKLKSPDVLLVGGVFGALGYVLNWLLSFVPNIGGYPWTMTIALAIVINAIIARVMFGKTGVFGTVRKGDSRWVVTDVASWLPWQEKPLELLTIGIGVGLPAAYIVLQFPDLLYLCFGFVTVFLVFLEYGTPVPATHHIALAAGMAIVVFGGDLWWGLAFALLAAYLCEIFAGLFVYHGDNHIDPPACALCITTTLQTILAVTGVMALHGIVSLVIAIVVGAGGYFLIGALKGQKSPAAA
jgi:hypothetical protein